MKLHRIKSVIPAAALMLSMGLTTACVNDLHVDNINPQQTSDFNADALLNKIYASFVLTGQKGPDGNGDIADFDEGRSEFYRMNWEMNEFTTDEAHWEWLNDAGVPDIIHNTYGSDNPRTQGLYYRLFFTITLCNYYLEQTAGDNSAETALKRAEARFIRALDYYYVMDLYGNATFVEKVSLEPGIRYTREQYFSYIENELKELENLLAAPGQNKYGRVDKVAAQLLLARLYLNAEVYTGNARWQDAKDYAEKVINNGYYHLCETGATNPSTGEQYSPYQMLFLADNDTNGAQYENVFPVLHDGINTTSHGAMNFLVLASYAKPSTDNQDITVPSGTDCSWGKCLRVRSSLIDTFFGNVELPEETESVKQITDIAGDDRALFYTGDAKAKYTRTITDESDQSMGYSCIKFRNVRSDGKPASSLAKVDTDLPLMRIAEAYLTFAEAETRLNGATAAAKEKIDALRSRAHAITQAEYSLSDILSEWSKEYWFEGRRRVDLVRFGLFGGQNKYTWEWMGNNLNGTQFPAFRNIFPLPKNDLTNNPNLIQNEGY
ncbi:MAG: RagB/SusD family nutrient uptake outer membrane protein [Prevotella sp.]|nr:RagB/SusD family nutrient uptake outer membrane protein [Prevotella sp.]